MRKRYIQDPVTFELVPAEEYVRPGLHIQEDIEPFISPVDGSVISSRSALREHNRKHGVVPSSEMEDTVQAARKRREDFYLGRSYDTRRRKEALKLAYELHNTGRSPTDIREIVDNYRNRSD